jgi:hypothetical protein
VGLIDPLLQHTACPKSDDLSGRNGYGLSSLRIPAFVSLSFFNIKLAESRDENRFFGGHLPRLRPTAGYHGDARRYVTEIKPVMERLGLSPADLVRSA